jgi:hypothetical protein
VLRQLAELEYRVDSSIRPFYEDRHFSYSDAQEKPYWPDYEDILQEGDQRELLEIPATEGFNRPWFRFCNAAHKSLSKGSLRRLRLNGVLWRLGLLRKIAVTPEGTCAQDVNACIDSVVCRGGGLVNLFLHSSDLMPGCTPYVRTAAELDGLYETLEQVFTHSVSRHGFEFCSVRHAYDQISAKERST